MLYDSNDVQSAGVKVALSWLGVLLAHLGIHGWGDLAAMVATVYTLMLIGEWLFKKFRQIVQWWRNRKLTPMGEM